MYDLDALVVAYKNEETIKQLLQSLVSSSRGIASINVILHDNGPGSGTAATAVPFAQTIGLPLTVQVCEDNCGFARGCNSASRAGNAGHMLLINPDACLLKLPTAPSEEQVWGGIVLDETGRQQTTYGRTRTLWDEVRLRWLRQRPHVPTGQGYVSGACMLVGRQLYASLSGLDEQFYMYYEDIDFCHRANLQTIPVRLHPELIATHQGGHSSGQQAAIRSLKISWVSGRRWHRRSPELYDALCWTDAIARALFHLRYLRWKQVLSYWQLAAYIATTSWRGRVAE